MATAYHTARLYPNIAMHLKPAISTAILLLIIPATTTIVRGASSVAFRTGVDSGTISTDAGTSYECSPSNAAKWAFSNGYPTADASVSALIHVGPGPEINDSRKAWIGFTGIFGDGPGQIPYGSSIKSATLRLVLSSDNRPNDSPVELHRILNSENAWFGSETKSTWRFKNKAQQEKWKDAGGCEVAQLSDASSQDASIGVFAASAPAGTAVDIDMTKTVAAWATKADGPDANLGWCLWLGQEGATIVIASPSHPKPAYRPTLLVQFDPPAKQ